MVYYSIFHAVNPSACMCKELLCHYNIANSTCMSVLTCLICKKTHNGGGGGGGGGGVVIQVNQSNNNKIRFMIMDNVCFYYLHCR